MNEKQLRDFAKTDTSDLPEKKAFVEGFLKRAADYGYTRKEAFGLYKKAVNTQPSRSGTTSGYIPDPGKQWRGTAFHGSPVFNMIYGKPKPQPQGGQAVGQNTKAPALKSYAPSEAIVPPTPTPTPTPTAAPTPAAAPAPAPAAAPAPAQQAQAPAAAPAPAQQAQAPQAISQNTPAQNTAGLRADSGGVGSPPSAPISPAAPKPPAAPANPYARFSTQQLQDQQKVMQMYPELSRQGTAMNKRFVEEYKRREAAGQPVNAIALGQELFGKATTGPNHSQVGGQASSNVPRANAGEMATRVGYEGLVNMGINPFSVESLQNMDQNQIREMMRQKNTYDYNSDVSYGSQSRGGFRSGTPYRYLDGGLPAAQRSENISYGPKPAQHGTGKKLSDYVSAGGNNMGRRLG